MQLRTERMWGVIQADLEAPGDPAELAVFLEEGWGQKPEDPGEAWEGLPVLPGGAGPGVSGLRLAS